MLALNTTFTTICSSWIGLNCLLSSRACKTIYTMFMMNENMPKLMEGICRLSTYGMLEICEVPKAPLVISTIPKELMRIPAENQTSLSIWRLIPAPPDWR